MTTTRSVPAEAPPARPPVLPLQPEDPPRLGGFWLRGRIGVTAAGYLYAGQDEADRACVVAMMAEGAADDPAARDRFRHALDRLAPGIVLARNGGDDADLAPWAAVGPVFAGPGDAGSSGDADARRLAEGHGRDLLSAVLMDRIPHLGRFRGPDFRHYWENRRRPGLFRLWPLPWPGAMKPASWLAIVLAMLTMLALMTAALFVAWLLFRNQPEVDPGPPIDNPSSTVSATPTPPTSSPPTTGGPSPPPTTGTTATQTAPNPTATGTGGPPTSGSTVLPSTPGPGNPEDRY